MKALGFGASLIAAAALVGVPLVGCTSGTTPDCSDAECSIVSEVEAGEDASSEAGGDGGEAGVQDSGGAAEAEASTDGGAADARADAAD